MSGWLRRRSALDRVLAAVLLVAALPVIAVLVLVVRATSPGRALIRLPRVGRYGRRFGMWKLRTMRAGSGGRAPGAPLTALDDPRVTAVGRFLRRSRLDELPQLLNVLCGDMALIGPRPETPEYVDTDDPRWTCVLQARPGLAGPTQVLVHGIEGSVLARGGEDAYRTELLPAKLAIDAWYLRHASAGVDLLVVAGVVQELLLRRRAALERRVHGAVPEARGLAYRSVP